MQLKDGSYLMQSQPGIGALVQSTAFKGIGKVLAIDHEQLCMEVGFFKSPTRPEANRIWVPIKRLRSAVLFQEAIVYCRCESGGIWRRGRYRGQVDTNIHEVVFRQNDAGDFDISEIYCMNLDQTTPLSPDEFLAARSNDAPYFVPIRFGFVKAYLEQRASCRSIAAIPSSSVALEPHQLAVVRRVLQDPSPKYLLGDEVGLGKTIEAGIIIRAHLLERKRDSRVIVGVPESLKHQWTEELGRRFHLGELIGDESEKETLIRICSHEDLARVLARETPTLLAVDEAHQIAPWAWSEAPVHRHHFQRIAKASRTAEVVLLLSGTPLHGNEKNYLSMLHLLSPENHVLDMDGIARFRSLIQDRENLGGIVSALTPANSNVALEGILDELEPWTQKDPKLAEGVSRMRRWVDWNQPEDGPERNEEIRRLRKYVGEAYSLHRRMLRNRRENETLAQLFPGLAGLEIALWPVSQGNSSTDEWLEEYRIAAVQSAEAFIGMDMKTFGSWVDDLLINPSRVADRAEKLLEVCKGSLPKEEHEILSSLVVDARVDQKGKDATLIAYLTAWLVTHPQGKVVIFCGTPDTADHVHRFLHRDFGFLVERHESDQFLRFSHPSNPIRILVCDFRGEDGLNLHGVSRLAVHYSLTRTISRMEQRLGRLNRYCPDLRGAKPVHSLALAPDRNGLIQKWLNLQDQGIGLFHSTVASLQYFLEGHLAQLWNEVATSGDQCLESAIPSFNGDSGLIALERRKVRAQEELNSMDEDVAEAVEFAECLTSADEEAETQAHLMSKWLTEGLHFQKRSDREGVVRFFFDLGSHASNRTLVDAQTFMDTCLTGIDQESGYPPRTEPMSPSRELAASGNGIYPLRFGQPFIDSIWDLMQTDSRGASWAFLRPVNNPKFHEPRFCFRLDWLISSCPPSCPIVEVRKGDEAFPPIIHSQWLREDGQPLPSKTIDFLSRPYDKERGGRLGDLSLRSEVWEQLEEHLQPRSWAVAVRSVVDLGRNRALHEIKTSKKSHGTLHAHLLSMGAVILCHPDLVEVAKEAPGEA